MPKTAAIQLEKFAGQQTLNVRVPSDITEKEFARLGKPIIDIIKGHTGCTCLSGIIRVVLEEDMREAIMVQLSEK
jgi:hypothetical protein